MNTLLCLTRNAAHGQVPEHTCMHATVLWRCSGLLVVDCLRVVRMSMDAFSKCVCATSSSFKGDVSWEVWRSGVLWFLSCASLVPVDSSSFTSQARKLPRERKLDHSCTTLEVFKHVRSDMPFRCLA